MKNRLISVHLLFTSILIPAGCTAQETDKNSQASAVASGAIGNYSDFPAFHRRLVDYLDRAAGPVTELRVGLEAGVSQGVDHPSGWGQGGDGYVRRYGWWWAQNWIAETSRFGVDESFHLDGTYHRSSASGVASRIRHAFEETFVARTRSGRTIVSASALLSPYVGAMYSTYAWSPHPSWKQGIKTGSISLAIQPGLNLLREFVFKH